MSELRPSRARSQVLRRAPLTRLKRRLPREKRNLNPFFARAGGSSSGGPMPGGRATRGIAGMVFLFLMLLVGRWYAGKTFNVTAQVERVIRGQVIPGLEKQLGTKIEVGSIESDWLSRIILRDVVVGRNAKLPTGALARARSVTITVDMVGLATKRVPVTEAIENVALDSPQIYIERGKDKIWNFSKLFKSHKPGAKTIWHGIATWSNGRVYYQDEFIRSAANAPLIADADQISGRAESPREGPVAFSANVGRAFLGPQRLPVGAVPAQGTFDIAQQNLGLALVAPKAPAPFVAAYLFRRKEVTITSGVGYGPVQISFVNKHLSARGQVRLEGVGGTLPPIPNINGKRPLPFSGLAGPLIFSNKAFSTSGATVQVAGTPVQVAGDAALLDQATFDLSLASTAADPKRLLPLLPKAWVPVAISSKPLRVSARVSGVPTDVSVTGAADVAGLGVVHPRWGRIEARMSRIVFAATAAKNRPLRLASRFDLRSITGRHNTEGGAADTATGTLRLVQNGPVEIQATARNWSGTSAKYGTVRGQGLRLLTSASRPDGAWQGNATVQDAATRGLKLAALSPQAAQVIRETGAVNAALRFAGLNTPTPSATGRVSLASATVNAGSLGIFHISQGTGNLSYARGAVRLVDVRAQSDTGPLELNLYAAPGKAPRVAVTARELVVPATRLNPLLASQGVRLEGDARGRLTLASTPNRAGVYAAAFSLELPHAAVLSNGAVTPNVILGHSVVSGQGEVSTTGGAWSGSATVVAERALVRSGRIGRSTLTVPPWLNGVRSAGMRLLLTASSNSLRTARPNITGRLTAERIALPGLALTGPNAPPFTLRAADLSFQTGSSGFQIPRLSVGLGTGTLTGHAGILTDGRASGEFLARNLNAATLQRVFVPGSLSQVRLAGGLAARISIATTDKGIQPRARVVLHNGSISTGEVSWPVEVAEATVVPAANGQVQIEKFVAWSRGGRLAATGIIGKLPPVQPAAGTVLTASPAPAPANGFAGQLSLSNLRLADLGNLPGLQTLKTNAKADGLVSGEFQARISEQASLEGQARLRLASLFGLDVGQASTKVAVSSSSQSFNLQLTDLAGKVEGADVSGSIEADTGRNTWHVVFKTEGVSTTRLARARSIRPESLPVRGDLNADVDMSGTLRSGNQFMPSPREGYLHLSTGALTWKGRPLGTLKADLEAENGLLRTRAVELRRNPTDVQPIVSVSGSLPLSAEQQGLDAEVKIADAQLDFVFEILSETGDMLENAGVQAPPFQRAVGFIEALPPGATGRVGVNAHVTGAWKTPKVEVTSLTLNDGRARTPAGGLSPPATLDAAFTYENGALTIPRAEFRLKKSAAVGQEEVDDTLLRLTQPGRIVPDGEVDLAADVLNANLSELATWVPALWSADGTPVLRGELSEFTFKVAGTTQNPEVTGSIQAEPLIFNQYQVDLLRISLFEIKNGYLSVDPGRLAVRKGNFRFTTASAKIPWSWTIPGPVRTAPMEVHFPVDKNDFGALVSLFLPALQAADADEFAGSLDVTGSIQEPRLAGFVKVKGGRFRLDPVQTALEAGVTDFSGTVRFVDGNRLEIVADDPLRGRLTSARTIQAREVRRARRDRNEDAPELDGLFSLRGGVTFDLAAMNLLDPRSAISRHRYDLTFALDKLRYSSPALSGISDGTFAAIFRTGAGDPNHNQNLRWMMAAKGLPTKRAKNGGEVLSVGSLRLRPDFGTSLVELGKSQALDFAGVEDFAGLPVAQRINLNELPDRRSQLWVRDLAVSSQNVATGVLSGRLVLDNQSPVQTAPEEAVKLRQASITSRLKDLRQNTTLLGTGGTPGLHFIQADAQPQVPLRELAPDNDEGALLRLGGSITISNAEIYGAPAGGGIPLRLSLMPAAPLFDIKLTVGKNVSIATATLRATLEGDIVVGGTPQSPQIYGTLSTLEGQVRFPNARARLDEGRLTIAATRDQALDQLRVRVEVDVTARGRSGRYDLTLRVRGPLDLSGGDTQNLRVDVTSNPPISQNEAFAQLLGISPDAQGGDLEEAYGKAVIQVISTSLFSGFERSIASALGLTAISFDYRFNEPLAVEFSKNIGSRIVISYRRSLSGGAAAGSTLSGTNNSSTRTPFELRLDYRVKGNLSIGIQTDQDNVRTLSLQKTWRF